MAAKKFGEIKLGTNLGASVFEKRTKLSDVGAVKTPPNAPPPSSKGSISYPKEPGSPPGAKYGAK